MSNRDSLNSGKTIQPTEDENEFSLKVEQAIPSIEKAKTEEELIEAFNIAVNLKNLTTRGSDTDKMWEYIKTPGRGSSESIDWEEYEKTPEHRLSKATEDALKKLSIEQPEY